MSGYIKTRSRTKGNKTTMGDASAAPDNPGNSRIREERGHEVRALSNNTMTTRMLTSSSFHRSMELGQNQYGSASLERPGSVPTSSERPGNGRTTPNDARAMQTTASSTFDDYGAGNGPNTSGTSSCDPTTSNDTRMVQTIAPSLLLSDNDAVPTGSGTATFQNVEMT